jgi:hypothetical protein
LDGLQVAQAYQRHIEYNSPLEPRFLDYNEDDVRVLQYLIEKCFRLRSHETKSHPINIDYSTSWVYIKTKLDPWLTPRSP